MPKVSVSIPCYNATRTPDAERWLRTSIESVLDQTVDDFELLLVDDGSTDETGEVCKEYLEDDRVEYVYQENQGYPGARNTGLDWADGEYLAFIGQDDRWSPEKLERQLSFLDDTGADLVHTNVYHIDERGEITGIRQDERPPKQTDREEFIRELFLGNFICIQSVLVRQSSVEPYRFDENLHINSDHVMWLQVAGESDIRYMDECLVKKRYHGENTSGDYERIFDERRYVADKAVELYPFLDDLWNEKMGDAYSMHGINLLKDGEIDRAREALRTAIKYDPWNLETYGAYLLSLGGEGVGSRLISRVSDPRPGTTIEGKAVDIPQGER
jgi:glycosyltransferase involved in cell wall biosynthesis